jgi:cytosine/adenosine deaminase-related metal-dependent hydrolase
MSCHRQLITAAMVVDGAGVRAAPGALLLEGRSVVAAGSPQAIGDAAGAARLEMPGAIVMPALVNAHAHLDLTHMPRIPFDGDFAAWIDRVRGGRAADDDAIEASVRRGIELSLAGGTALIGDIGGAGSTVPLQVLRESPLGGVGFIEVFGIGSARQRGLALIKRIVSEAVADAGAVRLGLQPHAPYSCDGIVYEAARASGLPLCTHLAETPDEIEFTVRATGPLADMLRSFGLWDESITARRRHPIDDVCEVLGGVPLVAAHVNYLEDRHLKALAAASITVAYCPRASAYFGHPRTRPHPRPRAAQPPHRYREMIDAGVNVALGTDGALCLDTPDRIGVLDEMRLLWRRDGTDPRMLLRMATINGGQALGCDPSLVTFELGPVAGVIAVDIDPHEPADPLVQALGHDRAPRWVIAPGPAV